jgi:hypothetical protein
MCVTSQPTPVTDHFGEIKIVGVLVAIVGDFVAPVALLGAVLDVFCVAVLSTKSSSTMHVRAVLKGTI